MGGYTTTAVFRISPMSGVDRIINLHIVLTDTGGFGPVKLALSHEFEMKERVDVNGALQIDVLGFRGEAEITVDILTMSDQAYIADIVNSLAKPRDCTVYFSSDGRTTERAVRMIRYRGPTPLNDKTFNGGRYVISLKARARKR